MSVKNESKKKNSPAETAPPTIPNPVITHLLENAALTSTTLSHHGYFPKEIARYLGSMLKEEGVACEVGLDKELMVSKKPEVLELCEKFHDSKPFYFLAFPLENRTQVIELLAKTDWPVPPDVEADKLAEGMEAAKVIHKVHRQKRRSSATLLVVGIVAFALLAFIWVGKQLF